ncbi:hypothetical protein G6011_00289 [Alternaria panax]|uniref:Uncharacterized protein n=1 Tax=Alternaria panax TaxID=48097 RepID=A0AAD4IIX4_9PLEO|nr:hypothetical protein G6011_00289 [Alternaria panax]
MSELSNIPPVAHQIGLVLHTAVDFAPEQGIGIGIIQRAMTGAARTSTIPTEEHKHGIERGQYGIRNVRTRQRAHMFALVCAMGLARSTLRRECTTTRIKVQSVTVLCRLPAVVDMIKYHQAHDSASLESVVSTEDRLMIRSVLASAKQLSRYNVQVSVVEDGEEGNTAEAARVKVVARQRKKKTCRRRCHERRIMSANLGKAGDEEEDGVNDKEGNESGDEEERINNSSHSGLMTKGQSSSK